MDRFAAGGLAVFLLSAVGLAEEPKTTESRSLTERVLGSKSETKSAEKPVEKSKAVATPMRPPVIIAPLSAEVLTEAVKDEQNACTRRLDICAKLREIAITKNDDAMLQRIDELERQSVEICQSRVARMGIRGPSTRMVRTTSSSEMPSVDPASVAPPVPVGGSR